jgi:hypothetical protein
MMLRKVYQRAVQGYKKALGVDHTTINILAINTLWTFGSIFECQNELANPGIMCLETPVGYKLIVGPDHPRSASLRDKLRVLDIRFDNPRIREGQRVYASTPPFLVFIIT